MNICFIAGTGRSGTTILRRIFGQHPLVAILPFESRFIVDPDGIVDFYCSYTSLWSPYMSDIRLKRLEKLLIDTSKQNIFHTAIQGVLNKIIDKSGLIISRKRYSGVNLGKFAPKIDEHITHLISDLCDFCYNGTWVGAKSYTLKPNIYFSAPKSKEDLANILGEFIRRVIDSIMKEQNKNFFVEDTPRGNMLFAPELLDLVPEAKIIHIYRDPRDVVASYSKKR